MERIASVPGLPPIRACAALLAAWEMAARLLAIDGLPPASAALAQSELTHFDPAAGWVPVGKLRPRLSALRRYFAATSTSWANSEYGGPSASTTISAPVASAPASKQRITLGSSRARRARSGAR